MPKITLMVGFPGSGKSTFLARSDTAIEERKKETVILCPDDFRLVLTGQNYYGPAEDSVWSHVKTTARVLIRFCHCSIIIDATHLTTGSRSQWIRMAKELNVPIDCWWYNVSPELARYRNKIRTQQVPADIMDRMIEGFVKPDIEEGFAEIETLFDENDNAR